MPTAYILINTEIGAENQVLRALKDLDGVEEAYKLWGIYDIIASVAADDMDKLKQIITRRIDEIGKINSKLTMIVSDKAPSMFPIQKTEEKHDITEFEPVPVLA